MSKILFDGNGSGVIYIVGLGAYVPAEKHNEVMIKLQQAQEDRDALAARLRAIREAMDKGANNG